MHAVSQQGNCRHQTSPPVWCFTSVSEFWVVPNRAVVKPVLPPSKSLWVFVSPITGYYVQIYRHPQNRKYITYRNATTEWPRQDSNLNRFSHFFTGRFLSKFAVKWILNTSPQLAYVATLPCETLMSAKQVIIDKLQSSVATYLRSGGVINNQIKKGLLLSVRVNFF